MHRLAGHAAVEAGDHVDARIAVGVARRALGTDQLGLEAEPAQTGGEILRAWSVGVARRVDSGEADKIGRQRHEVFGAALDRFEQSFLHGLS